MVSPVSSFYTQTDAFFTQLASTMTEYGLPLKLGPMDHVCYRAATNEEYLSLKKTFARHGRVLVEGMIGGRPIITYALQQPLSGPFGPVPCLELAAPKPGKTHYAGLEHGEIVVPCLNILLERYPDIPFSRKGMPEEVTLALPPLQVKFHCQSLADTIALEIAEGAVVPVPDNYFL